VELVMQVSLFGYRTERSGRICRAGMIPLGNAENYSMSVQKSDRTRIDLLQF
jgi:hypothetical protein